MKRCVAIGVFVGLLLFVLETLLVLRAEAAGLSIDIKGPFAALVEIAKAQLPILLAKIALTYAVVCALFALLAIGFVREAGLHTFWFFPLFVFELALAVWGRAIRTPALFDDLPHVRGALGWLVNHGEPWHPIAAGGGILALLMARILKRRGALRSVAWLAFFGALALAASFLAKPKRVETKHPLVLLFGIDALRPDRLHVLGDNRQVLPNLDAFVADATLFTRAYTPIAQTEPAWRSLLTGLSPHEHGLRYSLIRASERKKTDTFAQKFAAAGYQTVFRTDCSRFNFQGEDSGFGERVQPPRGTLNFLLEKLRYRGLVTLAGARLATWVAPELAANRALAGFYDPMAYAEQMANEIVERAAKGPLLYAYHATAAHFPGDPAYPYYRRFGLSALPLENRLRMQFKPVDGTPQTGDGGEALYDALVSEADAQLGIVLRALERAGLYDTATIVVFSDHGEDFYADFPRLKGAMSVHGSFLSEDQNRIVLAVRAGQKKRGPTQVDSLVRLQDIGPTLLELSGLSPKLGSAESLVPALENRPLTPRLLTAETTFTHVLPSVLSSTHYTGARRDFEAYHLFPSGLVEVADETHAQIMREKDVGVFDGTNWLVEWRSADGALHDRCSGDCASLSIPTDIRP